MNQATYDGSSLSVIGKVLSGANQPALLHLNARPQHQVCDAQSETSLSCFASGFGGNSPLAATAAVGRSLTSNLKTSGRA